MDRKLVRIVIPLNKASLTENEELALKQCLRVLGNYPVCLLKPQTLDVRTLISKYPQLKVESFPNYFFDSIYNYNILMLSTGFYRRFIDFEYLLIYQLDAFVFRDELKFWCKKRYDYIGGPWVIKPKYHRLYYKIFLVLKTCSYKVLRKRRLLIGLVGNGGFSLRRVEKFYQATLQKKDLIEKYVKANKEKKKKFNEDVFWSIENPDFCYPDYEEALQFAFDHHPEICMKQRKGRLPFGCHGWSKEKNIHFWKEIIFKYSKSEHSQLSD